MSRVVVIGGGPAGMMSAISAARMGHTVIVIEQNNKLGKKLYITGKGRCNLTNACDVDTLLNNVVSNPKFLYSSFYGFDSEQTIYFFNELGLKTKIERGNRVFPESDKASDVIDILRRACKRLDIKICLNTKVVKLVHDGKVIKGIQTEQDVIKCDNVVVATGGYSYQMTGSTGDGYRFAKDTGHKVVSPVQSLVPLEIKEEWVKELQGLSLKNVVCKLSSNKTVYYEAFGEMLFTHFGVSGPLILSGSSYLKNASYPIECYIDLKPKLTIEQLDQRILRDFNLYSRKNFENALGDLLPKKLIPIIVKLSEINQTKKVDQITKKERERLVKLFKALPLTVLNKRSFNEAIITQGGINVAEINPNTMESKRIKGLYFVGETIDVDALTGGFNLQIAFATAFLAGSSIVER